MIMRVDELKEFIETKESDEVLEARLQALESLIRKYTNNNFLIKNFRFESYIINGQVLACKLFNVGDTVLISNSLYNDGLYQIESITDGKISLNKVLYEEDLPITLSKVTYPQDVKQGIINLIKYDLESRNKLGIASESISRHSVSYINYDDNNSIIGYPSNLIGFLKPYIKARF